MALFQGKDLSTAKDNFKYLRMVISDIKNGKKIKFITNDKNRKSGSYCVTGPAEELEEIIKSDTIFSSRLQKVYGILKEGSKFKEIFQIKDQETKFRWTEIDKSPYSGYANKLKISTDEQEQIAMAILKEKISGSGRSKNYKSFDEMWETKSSGLQNIYKKGDVRLLGEWYNHFILLFNEVKTVNNMPISNYEVFSQSDGFMKWVSDFVRSEFQITKKDSWNPADVWLIRSTKTENDYKKLFQEENENKGLTRKRFNEILRDAYHKRDIVGISLKKTDGKRLHYELVNLEKNAGQQKLPFCNFISLNLNLGFKNHDNGHMNFYKTSVISFKDTGKVQNTVDFRIGSNQSSISNITFEMKYKTGSAFLGKVPKDFLESELKKLGFGIPTHNTYQSFNRDYWETRINKIRSVFNTNTDVIGIDGFIDKLQKSFEGEEGGRNVYNTSIMQIAEFAYICACLKEKSSSEGRDYILNRFLTRIYYLSQKKGIKEGFGPFGKLY